MSCRFRRGRRRVACVGDPTVVKAALLRGYYCRCVVCKGTTGFAPSEDGALREWDRWMEIEERINAASLASGQAATLSRRKQRVRIPYWLLRVPWFDSTARVRPLWRRLVRRGGSNPPYRWHLRAVPTAYTY